MENKVALVTGASRGIGKAIALALGQHGWDVAINYRGSEGAAREVREQVLKGGGRSEIIQADIGLASHRESLVINVLETFGKIDLLVNNAGMAPRQRVDLLKVSEASYDEVMQTNLKGPFFLTQAVALKMIEQVKSGVISSPKIINIGSINAYTASITRGEYCLSKAGLGMMTFLFSDRLAREGILVYEVRPGIIETDMTGAVHEKYNVLISEGLLPMQRWGKPEDVARAVIAIAEDYLPYSTGEIINVDGGFHLRRL